MGKGDWRITSVDCLGMIRAWFTKIGTGQCKTADHKYLIHTWGDSFADPDDCMQKCQDMGPDCVGVTTGGEKGDECKMHANNDKAQFMITAKKNWGMHMADYCQGDCVPATANGSTKYACW